MRAHHVFHNVDDTGCNELLALILFGPDAEVQDLLHETHGVDPRRTVLVTLLVSLISLIPSYAMIATLFSQAMRQTRICC